MTEPANNFVDKTNLRRFWCKFKKILPGFIVNQQRIIGVLVVVAVASVGVYFWAGSHAAGSSVGLETENGALAAGACSQNDSSASGGSYVQFGNCNSTPAAGEDTTCEFLTAPAGSKPAFCDNFTNEQPASYSARSGPLSPVWGISRMTNNTNVGQGANDRWVGVSPGAENDVPYSGAGPCGPAAIGYVKNSDIIVNCTDSNTHTNYPGIIETTNDGENDSQTILAAYPRQPFDIAGRTGTAVFDATVNTQSPHAGWPVWAYTDEPVPAPTSFLPNGGNTSATDNAKNSIGVDFDGTCDPGSGNAYCNVANYPQTYNSNKDVCITVGNIWVTVNYQPQYLNMNQDGCVLASTLDTTCYPAGVGDAGQPNTYDSGPNPGCTSGQAIPYTGMDHFEIQINSTGIYVYGQNYNQKTSSGQYETPYLLADAEWNKNGNPSLPLTRGLTWMEDVHYNGDKFNHQAENSFEWDNFGFDGPVLPRDLAYDVPDDTSGNCTLANASSSGCLSGNGYPSVDLGYYIPEYDYSPNSTTLTINNVDLCTASTTDSVCHVPPTGALMVFNWWPTMGNSLQVSVNGNTPIKVEDPNTPVYTDGATGAVIIPLSELKKGTNTFQFSVPDCTGGCGGGTILAEVDLILQGSGGTYSP